MEIAPKLVAEVSKNGTEILKCNQGIEERNALVLSIVKINAINMLVASVSIAISNYFL